MHIKAGWGTSGQACVTGMLKRLGQSGGFDIELLVSLASIFPIVPFVLLSALSRRT